MKSGDDLDRLIARLEAEQTRRASRTRPTPSEEEAWERLRVHLRQNARKIVRPDDVDDVVQTVLLKLQSAEALRRLRASRSPAGYLAVMIRNAAMDSHRGRAEDLDSTASLDRVDESASPSDSLSEAERAKRLTDLLATLSEEDRELLRERYWEELTIARMARRYRVRYSTMAVRLFRIVRRLRAQLGPGADREW